VVDGNLVPCIDFESRLYTTVTCSGIPQIFGFYALICSIFQGTQA
jgi:hypothetical protein